jgi:hypothetical protein
VVTLTPITVFGNREIVRCFNPLAGGDTGAMLYILLIVLLVLLLFGGGTWYRGRSRL